MTYSPIRIYVIIDINSGQILDRETSKGNLFQ